MLFKSFAMSKFTYSPVVWMCQSSGLNSKINNIHEIALKIVYQNKKSSFKTLLKHDKYTSVHTKNLQYLATELFKAKNDRSQKIMKKISLYIAVIIKHERTFEQRNMN